VTSAAHALTAGTIIMISGVVGMTELNGRAFVVANPGTNTFELKGVDATTYTAYASGGIATPQTMSAVGSGREHGRLRRRSR
jgi:predicted extracellular nuclease